MNIVSSGTSATKIPKIIEEGQGQSIFSGLDTGNNNSETGSLVSGGLKGMLTGEAYSPYEQQSQEKLARAAQNLRASVGSSYANKMNQGSANKAMNQADQNIFSSIADTNLNIATEKQAMKERGITTALDVAKAQDSKRMSDIQTGMAADSAYGYTDAQGNQVRGSNVLQGEQVDITKKQVESGIALDQAKLAETSRQFNISTDQAQKQFNDTLKKDYAQLTQQDKQFLASLGLDQAKFEESKKQFATTTALDQARLTETARQFNISTDQAQKQFDAMLTKDYAQLSSQEKQFLSSLGLDQAKFEESKKQFASTIKLDQAKLNETARQFNVSTEQANKQFYDSLTKDYAALSQNDKQFLASLGLDQAKFEELKAQNTNQNNLAWAQLKSSEQIALKQIGVDENKLAETARQFNISTDVAVSQFKDTMKYNYSELSQKDQQFLQSLGMDQAKFEYQKVFDRNSLQFNYDQLSTNAKLSYDKMASDEKQFYAGLNSNEKMAYEQMNSNERIAYQDNQTKLLDINSNFLLTREGIVANQYIADQSNLNAITISGMKISADQSIASQQINSAEKLAQNANYLTQQGINLQEAALKGFIDPVTGKPVLGSQQIAAQELGLKETELDLMKKELLGDPATGLQGKLSLMNEEQQLRAKELIGYDKTNPDGTPILDANGKPIHVNGSLEAQQAQTDIQKAGLDLDKERFTDSKVRDNYSIALAAGDYAGANKIASEAGIPSIDYTKPMERESLTKANEAMDSAKQMLDSLGEYATPEQISLFAEKYASAWVEKEKLLGVPFDAKQLDDIVKSFETDGSTDNKALNTYVSSTVMDWWSNGEGLMYSGELTGKYADIQRAMATGKNADGTALSDAQVEDAAAQMGQLVWARYAASTGKFLTANQINMLTSSGILSDEERKALPQSALAEKDAAEQLKTDFKTVQTNLITQDAKIGTVLDKNNNPLLNNAEIATLVESESTLPNSKKSYTTTYNDGLDSVAKIRNWSDQQVGKIITSADGKKSYVITKVDGDNVYFYDPSTGLTTPIKTTLPKPANYSTTTSYSSMADYINRDKEQASRTDAENKAIYDAEVAKATAEIKSKFDSLFK